MIEGKLLVVVFDEHGEVTDKFIMERESTFIFRLGRGIIHTNIPLTDVVFHEVIEGPFVGKDDSVFPEWAPLPEKIESVEQLMNRITIGGQ